MRALLHNVPLIQDKDFIGMDNGRQAMGDDKVRSSSHQIGHGFLDQLFCSGVHRRSGFIQNQNLRVADKGAGDRQKLALSLGDIA